MIRAVRRPLSLIALLLAAACAGVATTRTTPQTPGDREIRVEALGTPLGLFGAALSPGVVYAGGLTLRGGDVHGLSDLKIVGDQAIAVSDLGHRIGFRLDLDTRGRLVGVSDAVSRALIDVDGASLAPKARADAEGLALLDDERMLISFEREHRVWSYGPGGQARPTPAPHPLADFPANQGMEGLAASGFDGWLVMGEAGGAWTCRDEGCVALAGHGPRGGDGFRVTGVDRDPAGGWFVVERFFRPPLDMRARVRRMAPDGVFGPVLIALRPPSSVDNFEGVAAVATATGARLYLLSDDNASPLQRTLLLAFDVAPGP